VFIVVEDVIKVVEDVVELVGGVVEVGPLGTPGPWTHHILIHNARLTQNISTWLTENISRIISILIK
jgi:hypothetical protein